MHVLKSTKIPIFPFHFLNVDSSFNIKDTLLKLFVAVLDMIMEGTQSQNFY